MGHFQKRLERFTRLRISNCFLTKCFVTQLLSCMVVLVDFQFNFQFGMHICGQGKD